MNRTLATLKGARSLKFAAAATASSRGTNAPATTIAEADAVAARNRRLASRLPGSPTKSINEENVPKNFFPVYVHHVSRVALEHLQDKRSGWLHSNGLDDGLHINPNGTFCLSFPSKIGSDSGRIWTSYDASRKQHWLSVYRHNLAVRFLLKDHGQSVEMTQVHDSAATDRIIHAAVDQMILAVNQMETKRKAVTPTTTTTTTTTR